MKKLYWRPQRVSRTELIILSGLAIVGYWCVAQFRVVTEQPYYKEKVAASRLALRAMEEIKAEKQRRKVSIDPDTDPSGSGLIGNLISPITSNSGSLVSKQTTANPNFAALVVHWLERVGVEPGDPVAVGVSGSFPAVNIAVYAALEAMQAKPVVVVSAASSQWGATDPMLTWLDMERLLYTKRIFGFRSVAASRGGIDDLALGLSKEGKWMLDDAIVRAGIKMLQPKNFDDSIDLRMAVYNEELPAIGEGRAYRAYINVGGGTASVGTRIGKRMFKAGINRHAPAGEPIDSVMTRFVNEGVPVLHMTKFTQLAARYGLPLAPRQMPPIGNGAIYVREEYSRLLAAAVLVLIVACMVAFIRLDIGFRILRRATEARGRGRPEPMV